MSELGDSYRAWIAKQKFTFAPKQADSMHFVFASPAAMGYLAFFPCPNGDELVEMRIQRSEHARPSFLTHFMLTDIWHARKLLREMMQTLETENARGPLRILVCDKPGLPPSDEVLQFVSRLRIVAQEPSVTCEFCAIPLDEIPSDDARVAAIVLAPSVGHLQRQTYLEHPDLICIPIPKMAFASLDAHRAFRLLLEALGEIDTLPPSACLVHPARRPTGTKTVLVVNIMYCDRCIRMGFRVFEGMNELTRGKVTKAFLSMDDIFDLLSTLFVYGVPAQSLDAIELLVPGVVNYCSMNLPSLGERDMCIADKIKDRYGIPTFIDNNTNVAAVGCYVMQNEFESISLYRHQLGHMNGGQGTVVGGKMITGLHGIAGEPKLYQRRFCYDEPYNHKVWSSEGLTKICLNVLRASMATIAPEALYISVGALDNLDEIRTGLARTLPKYCEPHIIAVDDYRERMYVGATALCHQRLSKQ